MGLSQKPCDFSIHALDVAVEKRIRARARKERKSLNQTLKELLAESVGAALTSLPGRRAEFAEFSGVWSKPDGDAVAAHMADAGQPQTEISVPGGVRLPQVVGDACRLRRWLGWGRVGWPVSRR